MATRNGFAPSDELTLAEAELLTACSRDDLVRAVQERRLPSMVGAYQQGSWEPRVRIKRCDLERFAGERFHAPGALSRGAVEVLSMCNTNGCRRYSPGRRCSLHGGGHEPLSRQLTSSEKTAYHEGAHQVVGRSLGWRVHSASIISDSGSGGHAVLDAPTTTVRDCATVLIAGAVGAAMASRSDWRALDLRGVLAREAEAAGEPFRAAADADATAAAERAAAILERAWTDVSWEALKLLKDHTIGSAA